MSGPIISEHPLTDAELERHRAQPCELIEFFTEKNIRMLEQLNKTLELLHSAQAIGGVKSDEQTVLQKVEDRVLECIAMICTPLVAVKQTSA